MNGHRSVKENERGRCPLGHSYCDCGKRTHHRAIRRSAGRDIAEQLAAR